MVDRNRDIALGGEVFAKVRHQETVAGVAVADHHQREGFAADRGGVTRGTAMQRDLGYAVAQDGLIGASRLGAFCGRVPDFDGQGAVIGRLVPLGGVHDVDLVGIGEFQRCHPDGQGAVGGKFGRVGANSVDPVLGVDGAGGEAGGQGERCQGSTHVVSGLVHSVRGFMVHG